jgi:uncharacterized damage-inducible protein DinB
MSAGLSFVYDGWDGFHRSIVNAVADLTPLQFTFRASPEMRTVGEVAWHIADGRVDWFRRIDAPGHADLQAEIEKRKGSPPESFDAAELVAWLNRTWEMVAATLAQWTVDDLSVAYHHTYQGKVYAVSRQWTIWRIMAHDIYHGGQLSEMLAMQGIFPVELTYLGGHLTEPPVVG